MKKILFLTLTITHFFSTHPMLDPFYLNTDEFSDQDKELYNMLNENLFPEIDYENLSPKDKFSYDNLDYDFFEQWYLTEDEVTLKNTIINIFKNKTYLRYDNIKYILDRKSFDAKKAELLKQKQMRTFHQLRAARIELSIAKKKYDVKLNDIPSVLKKYDELKNKINNTHYDQKLAQNVFKHRDDLWKKSCYEHANNYEHTNNFEDKPKHYTYFYQAILFAINRDKPKLISYLIENYNITKLKPKHEYSIAWAAKQSERIFSKEEIERCDISQKAIGIHEQKNKTIKNIIQILINAEMNIDALMTYTHIFNYNNESALEEKTIYNALFYAIKDYRFDLVQFLLKNGANPNIITNFNFKKFDILKNGKKKLLNSIRIEKSSLDILDDFDARRFPNECKQINKLLLNHCAEHSQEYKREKRSNVIKSALWIIGIPLLIYSYMTFLEKLKSLKLNIETSNEL